MEVVREKVTLEIGARGLRSLFSSKPSDKEVARVKRYGSLAVRVLRAVLAADGELDGAFFKGRLERAVRERRQYREIHGAAIGSSALLRLTPDLGLTTKAPTTAQGRS